MNLAACAGRWIEARIEGLCKYCVVRLGPLLHMLLRSTFMLFLFPDLFSYSFRIWIVDLASTIVGETHSESPTILFCKYIFPLFLK